MRSARKIAGLFGMSTKEQQYDFTFTIIGIGEDPIDGFFDALEGLTADPGAHIKSEVVYAKVREKDKPVAIIVDDIILRNNDR